MTDACRLQQRLGESQTAPTLLRNRRLVVPLFLMMVALMALAGCGVSTKDAKSVVKEGTATSQTLAAYYDELAQHEQARYDSVNYNKLALTNKGALPDDSDFPTLYSGSEPVGEVVAKFKAEQADEKAVIAALNARANTARKLNDLYVSLGNLVDYDASGEVSKAAGNLSDAIQQLNHHALTLTVPGINLPQQVSATNLLDGVVRAFAKQEQMRQIRKNAPLVRHVLEGMVLLYHAEQPGYNQLSANYYDEAQTIARNQINTNGAFLGSRRKTFLELFGLDMVLKPQDNQDLRTAEMNAATREVKRQHDAYVDKFKTDTTDLLTALCVLKVDHDRFEKHKPLTSGGATIDPDVKAYLDSLNQAP